MITPTILTGTKPGMKVRDEEIFGPVLVIEPYDDFEEALAQVNHSKYGLQAGLLTRDAGRILTAYRELEVGALIVGDTPNWRLDPMPYGGVKDSGLGREGIRWAIEEMTEPRMLVMSVARLTRESLFQAAVPSQGHRISRCVLPFLKKPRRESMLTGVCFAETERSKLNANALTRFRKYCALPRSCRVSAPSRSR